MNQKLVFLDLDGTIIDHNNHTIPESTLVALNEAKRNGHIIIIATGRSPSLLAGIEDILGIKTYIAANGRYVKHENQLIYSDNINPNIVKSLIKDAEALGLDLGIITSTEYLVVNRKTDLPKQFSEHFNLETPKSIDLFKDLDDVLQMVLYDQSNSWKRLERQYKSLAFHRSCEFGVDINGSDGMKDIGVKILCEYFRSTYDDVIAIGDGYNDISMIKLAGIGVAMGNGCQPLKEAADIITKSVDQDGIYAVFKRLDLI